MQSILRYVKPPGGCKQRTTSIWNCNARNWQPALKVVLLGIGGSFFAGCARFGYEQAEILSLQPLANTPFSIRLEKFVLCSFHRLTPFLSLNIYRISYACLETRWTHLEEFKLKYDQFFWYACWEWHCIEKTEIVDSEIFMRKTLFRKFGTLPKNYIPFYESVLVAPVYNISYEPALKLEFCNLSFLLNFQNSINARSDLPWTSMM